MNAARRLQRLEASAPTTIPSTARDDRAGRIARIIALAKGGTLPDGPPATAHEVKAGRILAIIAAARKVADDDAEGGS